MSNINVPATSGPRCHQRHPDEPLHCTRAKSHEGRHHFAWTHLAGQVRAVWGDPAADCQVCGATTTDGAVCRDCGLTDGPRGGPQERPGRDETPTGWDEPPAGWEGSLDDAVDAQGWCDECGIEVGVVEESDEQVGFEEHARDVRVTRLACGHERVTRVRVVRYL